jgi:hypothetical protein
VANQAIALQARAPQTDFMGRAIQQNAQMMNMMSQRRASERQAAQAAQEMQMAQAKEARDVELHGPAMAKAQSQATQEGIKVALDFSNFVYTGLSNAANREQAIQISQRIAAQPQFSDAMFQGALADALETMPEDPAMFPAWQDETLKKTLEGAQRLENQLTTQNLGTSTRIVATPKYGGGAARVVPGSEAAVDIKPTVVNVEGTGPVIVDPNTGQGFPVSAGAPGGYTPPRGGIVGGPRGAQPAPMGAGGVFDRMINVESRGQQFNREGKPLTSSAGAIGIAQVMPGTAPEAAKLAGLPFDDNRYRNDPEYNLALGRAYFEKQLADFGDERLAAAAYNAGPGAIRRALQKGGPNNWINHVPRETQNYVRDVFGEGGRGARGAGAPAAGTPPKQPKTFSEIENEKAFKKVIAMFGYDPDTGKDTISPLISASTSGGLEKFGSDVVGFVTGEATPGRVALNQLETLKDSMTFEKLRGKLGAQISNADVQLVANTMADIANPDKPANARLAAWQNVVLPILLRGAGIEPPKKGTAAGGKKKPPIESFGGRR